MRFTRRWRARGLRCANNSALRIPHSAFAARGGMTLVELLITMAIMAIITAAVLGTASAAMEAGRRSRTQGLVTRLNSLLMERWDSYANRKANVSPAILQQIETIYRNNLNSNPQYAATWRGQMLADARLLALRELMKMEMPDRWSDVVNQNMQDNVPFNDPDILATVPPVTQTYRRRLGAMQQNGVELEDILSNQGAECLYMIIMFHTGDGEARTLFSSQDIGDTDGDGAQEFLDGWGNPIQYIRWPAGFVRESALMTGDPEGDHDPFDVFRRDSPSVESPPNPQPGQYPPDMSVAIQELRNRNAKSTTSVGTISGGKELGAFRLVPLIYSIGPDENSDLLVDPEMMVELDPYADIYGDDDDLQIGAVIDQEGDGEGWQDNIHNQLNEY